MNTPRRTFALFTGLAVTAALTVTATAPAAALSNVDCAALAQPVYRAINPRTGTSLLSQSSTEVKNAAQYGYTDYQGEAFKASRYQTSTSMVGVHRLAKSGDFAYESNADRIAGLVADGYVDQGVNFYAATSSDWCTQPIEVTQKGEVHRYLPADDGQLKSLAAAGWTNGTVVYHVAAPPVRYGAPTTIERATRTDTSSTDQKFTFAVIPDTQPEVWKSGDPRFAQRSSWLVANQSKYDIRWAVQTGDLVDWDDATHSQYENAKVGLAPLQGHIPYFLNIGNHDSAATCYGGSACDGRFVPQMARMTRTFNQYFSVADYGATTGSFEPGKVDNTYARFKAGGHFWMIINLELWPRKEVVEWARQLVAKHSKHNVILATHSFLSSNGTLSSSASYGSTSPRYLYDTIVKKYKNVKFVLSGHVGSQRTKVLTGAGGNKVYAILTTYHSKTTNPVRMVEVDFSKNELRTWVEAPWTKTRLLNPAIYTKFGGV